MTKQQQIAAYTFITVVVGAAGIVYAYGTHLARQRGDPTAWVGTWIAGGCFLVVLLGVWRIWRTLR